MQLMKLESLLIKNKTIFVARNDCINYEYVELRKVLACSGLKASGFFLMYAMLVTNKTLYTVRSPRWQRYNLFRPLRPAVNISLAFHGQ